jgi:hypothetical protein
MPFPLFFVEPSDMKEAEKRQDQARKAVAEIEAQLRQKETTISADYRTWRNKAVWALNCRKEELTRINRWIRDHNRLVDLTLDGKDPILLKDKENPNQLLLHTYRLINKYCRNEGRIQSDQMEVLDAVRTYFHIHPELLKEIM